MMTEIMSNCWRLYAPWTCNNHAFYVKLAAKDSNLWEVFLTDYVKLWKKCFTRNDILEIMLDSNKNIEIESRESFINTGLQMLRDCNNQCNKIIIESNDGQLKVALTRISSFVLKMNFTLTACDAEEYYSAITQPMLQIIDDLKESETELRDLIKKKDFELEEYFRETNNMYSMMKCFTTLKYDDNSHMNRHNVMATHFGDDEGCSTSVKPKDVLNSHLLFHKLPPPTASSTVPQDFNIEPANSSAKTKTHSNWNMEPTFTSNDKVSMVNEITQPKRGKYETVKEEQDSHNATDLSRDVEEQSSHTEPCSNSVNNERDRILNDLSQRKSLRVKLTQKTTTKKVKKLNY